MFRPSMLAIFRFKLMYNLMYDLKTVNIDGRNM